MKIATWNVNSLRVRLPQALDLLARTTPDVLCIQETKVTDEEFPHDAVRAAGYEPLFTGQKTYNGVATFARRGEFADVIADLPGVDNVHKRFLAATIGGTRVINVYVPNGESVESAKYLYKLEWLNALTALLTDELKRFPRLVVLGDFNIAPEERDVHDPKRWAGKVLFSQPERAALQRLIDAGLVDVFRQFDQPEKSFTWWDYRLNGFARNWGLRIDHILCSPVLAAECRACHIDLEPRRHERPSDHTPVFAEFSAI